MPFRKLPTWLPTHEVRICTQIQRDECVNSGLLLQIYSSSLKGVSVIVCVSVCLGTYVSLCLSVWSYCASPVFHPTVLRGYSGCLLYRIGSKSISMLFEALLLTLSSTSTPFSLLPAPPLRPILHLCFIWTLW